MTILAYLACQVATVVHDHNVFILLFWFFLARNPCFVYIVFFFFFFFFFFWGGGVLLFLLFLLQICRVLICFRATLHFFFKSRSKGDMLDFDTP